MAQPGQRSAHRGLTEIEPVAGARDVAFGQQGVEGDEKIEVEEM
jgi:hypothetical protein